MTDIFQVIMFASRPDTTLGSSGPNIIPLLFSNKHLFKLNHTGVGKQEGGVIMGNKGRRFNNSMPLVGKKIEESGSYFVTFHRKMYNLYSVP